MKNQIIAILSQFVEFESSLADLCCLVEAESDFGMTADEMISTIREFIQSENV